MCASPAPTVGTPGERLPNAASPIQPRTNSNMTTDSDSGYRKFMHVERLGHRATQGITEGLVYVLPKLDGTNGVVWFADGEVRCGSRNNYLNPASGQDNHGFRAAMLADRFWPALFAKHPNWIVYGEWLVPHTVKHYEQDAWRKFYVFDVYDREAGVYLTPGNYAPAIGPLLLEDSSVRTLPYVRATNHSGEMLSGILESLSRHLTVDDKPGEGIVVKNYEWINAGQGHRAWAKIIHPNFANGKGKSEKPVTAGPVDQALVDRFCDVGHINKTLAKVVCTVATEQAIELPTEQDAWRQVAQDLKGKVIPRLMGQVLSDLWAEEGWQIFKAAKGASISTSQFKSLVDKKVKETLEWLF